MVGLGHPKPAELPHPIYSSLLHSVGLRQWDRVSLDLAEESELGLGVIRRVVGFRFEIGMGDGERGFAGSRLGLGLGLGLW